MEFEKIVSTILEKSGKTDVSKATVTMLAKLLPVADGAEPDEEYFDKMVNAVKSVQGNVNNVMSAKVTEQVNAKGYAVLPSPAAGVAKPYMAQISSSRSARRQSPVRV